MSFTKNAITTAVKTLVPDRNWPAEAITNNAWVRNPSWRSITAPSPSEQKIVGLYRIEPGGTNYAGFNITGAVTVDWGDGSAPENIASGVSASHLYDYAATALANTNAPATLTQSTSTVNRTAHGYTNGMFVTLYNITTTTGLISGQGYFVVNATTNSFQVSNSFGGSAVTFGTGNGTCTLLDHKQAIITITPQAGNDITTATFANRPTAYTVSGSGVSSGWLDVEMAIPQCTTLYWSSSAYTSFTAGWWHTRLERFSLRSSLIRQCSYMFYNCHSLRSLPNFAIDTTINVLNFTSAANTTQTVNNTMRANDSVVFLTNGNMAVPSLIYTSGIRYFTSPSSLTSTTAQFTSSPGGAGVTFSAAGNQVTGFAGVGANYMFANCYALTEIPGSIKAIPSIVTATFMFTACYSLTVVEGLQLQYCTAAESMFYQCYALCTVTGLDTSNMTRIQSFFSMCYSLKNVGYMDLSQVRQAATLFNQCYSLESVPPLNLSLCLQTGSMFYQCYALKSVPALNMPLVTIASTMFYQCFALRQVPDMYAPLVNNASGMFTSCSLLQTVGSLSLPANTDASSMFINCFNLREVGDINMPNVTTTANMFANCYGLLTVGTLTTSTALSTIANMFSACNALIRAPWITVTSAVTTANGVFQNCYALRYVPTYNLAANQNFSNFFTNCIALTDAPAFNTAAATTFSTMYSGCFALRNVPTHNVTATTSSAAYNNIFLSCISLRRTLTPFKFTFSVNGGSMSAAELDAMYTALPTVTAQTVTVTGNIGVATDNPAIATAKGWTVTG